MRVVHPLTTANPDAIAAISATRYPVEFADVSGSPRAYYDLLARLWSDGRTFAVVEHDIVIGPDTLDSLAACPHDWCSCPYRYGNTTTHGLGCVKFSAELIARNPDAMIRVGVMSDGSHERRHWCRLDAWLQGVVLPNAGEIRHEHSDEVTHLDSGCSHGCTSYF